MLKKLVFILIIFLVVLIPNPLGAAEGNYNQADIKTEELEEFLNKLDMELSSNFSEFSLANLFQDLKEGRLDFSLNAVLQNLINYLFRELLANSSILGQIIVLAILSAILQNLTSAFEQATISKLANSVIFLAIVSVILYSFNQIIKAGTLAVEQIMDFVYALLPILLTLVAAVGGFTTATIIHPVVLAGLSLLSSLIVQIVFPLIYFAAILAIIANISDQFQIGSIAKLMKEVSMGVLGLFLTVFVGILSIQGAASAMADGVALRTAKFLTGSFVPVVGKVFSEALETVIGTTLLLKSAVSLIGVIVVVVICMLPAVKIISMFLIYRLAAAIIQPFGESNISKMLESLSGILIIVFGAVASVGLMFFMVITITAGLGNLTVLLR